MFNKFHTRIIVLVSGCLAAFAAIAFFGLQRFELKFYVDQMLKMGPFLIEELLPDSESGNDIYARHLPALEQKTDLKLTVYAPDKTLLWGQEEDWKFDFADVPEGDWVHTWDEDFWATRLQDGRWVSLQLPDAEFSGKLSGLLLTLIAITILVVIVSIPVCFGITGRLERLNKSVQEIGRHDLKWRVPEEGKDEVAGVANSFNAALERIEKLLVSQKMLLANASHELRTPLARMRMGLELLSKQGANVGKYKLNDDIAELDSLIEEILILSRLSIESGAVKFEDVDLAELAREEATHYDNIDVNTRTTTNINGDARLIKRLIRNLLDNATIHGTPPISLAIKDIGKQIELTIIDEGQGIAPEEVTRIIAPFARGEGKQDIAGYGLGLAIVKEIAQAHGAKLNIDGSKMTVQFPKA